MFGSNLGALKVAIQKFYRINGNSTQYKGVTPHIFLPDPYSYAKNREQDLDYSLPWDQVEPLAHKKWRHNYFDISKLNKNSAARVKRNEKFKKMRQSIEFLKKRSKDTIASLNIDVVKKRNAKSKAFADKLKEDKANKNIMVSNYEKSLKHAEKIKKEDYKKWKEDFEQRKEEWVKSLQKDIGLEESLFVMNEMIETNKKNKLSLNKLEK